MNIKKGFLPTGFARTMFPVNIFRINEKTLELARDSAGLCIPIKSDESEYGMIMGKVRNDVLSRFEGYHNHHESNRKIVNNVFTQDTPGCQL